MKHPFHLGTRSLSLFETALYDVRTDELPAVLEKVSSPSSPVCDPRKQKLVEAEIARRKAADHALAVFFSFLPFLILLLPS